MSNMKIWLKKKEEKYKDKDKEEDQEEEEKILKCNTTTLTCYKVYLPWYIFLILAWNYGGTLWELEGLLRVCRLSCILNSTVDI